MSELNELAQALAKAQGKIEPAPKDSDNPFFKSKYASLPAVRDAMRDAFAENGLSVVQMPEVADGQLRLRTLLLHSSGQSLDCGTLAAEVDLSNPQKSGSAISYFRRYALAAISQVVTDEDDDGNAASLGKPKKQPKQLNAQDTKDVNDAIDYITNCPDYATLKKFGKETMVKQNAAVQTEVRPVYAKRKQELEQQNA